MKKRLKRIIPAALALALAVAPLSAYAEEKEEYGPGREYDDATLAHLEDNVIEYGELEELIDAYNPTLKNLWDTYRDNKDAAKDVAKLKDQIMSGSGQLLDAASQLSNGATQLEGMLGVSIPGMAIDTSPATYAGMVYSSLLLEQQAEQMTLSADTLTEVTPEMLKVQVVDTSRAALIAGAQSAMIGYEQLLLQKESLEDSLGLLEDVLRSTEAQASLGLATQNDVLSARQTLESAEAGMLTIDVNIQKIRQTLCTMTGWEYNASPEIRNVPAADMNRIGSMDPAADKAAAVDNNFTRKYNVLSYETLTDGSVEQANMDRTLAQQEAQIASSLVNLYNDVLQKRNEYQTAVAACELERTRMASAERKYAVGTIGGLEYRQQQNTLKTAEIAVKTADLTLFQAMETYDWAVRGNLSLS